jgi:hypothetical protein
MVISSVKCQLRENRGGRKVRYYFGKAPPNYPQLEHWKYSVPGKINFKGSTLIFKAEDFSPKHPRRNVLLDTFYKNPDTTGTLLLKLDLKETRSIHKFPSKSINYNFLEIRFYIHGDFIKHKIRDLNFTIRAETKKQIIDLYNLILAKTLSGDYDSEAGSLKFIEN